jgi:hypothetical protein
VARCDVGAAVTLLALAMARAEVCSLWLDEETIYTPVDRKVQIVLHHPPCHHQTKILRCRWC